MKCIICGAESQRSGHAIIAPFISELTASATPATVTLESCVCCEMSFFSHRYSDVELAALYGGYRSERYVRTRKRWEPWYRTAVNNAYAAGSNGLAVRLGFMEGLISQVTGRTFQVAVDVGGDEGQFFPSSAVGRKVVIDISGKQLPEGVETQNDLRSIDAPADLVMVCHVLEHLNDPASLLAEVRGAIDPTGLLYVEVPLDLPRLHRWHTRAVYRRYLSRIQSARPPLILMDFGSGASRQMRLRIPRFGIVKQSEHINYFSEKALRLLVTRSGFTVLASSAEPKATVGGLRLGKLGMVAVPRTDA